MLLNLQNLLPKYVVIATSLLGFRRALDKLVSNICISIHYKETPVLRIFQMHFPICLLEQQQLTRSQSADI